jgi:tRNA modification GTPase
MAVFFPNPRSFTGEDVLELHLHGAPVIVNQLYKELGGMPGVRVARPGEFSERAFHAGKLGLQDVEGLADLLAAETRAQRRQALWLLGGGARERVERWRGTLIEGLAGVEAFIDFSEDENIESKVIARVDTSIRNLMSELEKALSSKIGERVRDGMTVAIVGKPNAGKSSLFNALVGRQAAIVSPIAGTTRDVIQCSVDIGGFPVHLLDTAGIRDDSVDEVEREGVARARDAAAAADLVIHVVDGSDELESASVVPSVESPVITVYNKCDIYNNGIPADGLLAISCKEKTGIDQLVGGILDHIKSQQQQQQQQIGDSQTMPVITRPRHRQHLLCCLRHCKKALASGDVVEKAEALRAAARECGRVSGHVDVEDVLDSLFKSFCIGK